MKFIRYSILLLTCSFAISSCLKQNYDNPPSTAQYDPNLPVQTSIRTFTEMGLNMIAGTSRVLGDSTISGIVVANDQSGNYYKQIIIEDSARGGLILYLDRSYLYSDYPVGRKLYVKLKGLSLVNYKGLPEIVFAADSLGNTTGIPSGLLNDYIVKASYPNVFEPEEASIIDIKSNPNRYINTLVKLSDVQFNSGSANQPYSVPSSMASGTSRTLEDCQHTASVIMYNSAYSSFQSFLTPTGNGTVTGICSQYYSTVQFFIRDTMDVKMTNTRCP
jgi:hypothetical protein